MKFKRSSAASGITLLEVVASIALLGTLLTLVLVANAKNLRQIKAAERKRESVRMLDDFLATWSVHQFAMDGIADAAKRSGLPVVGDLGQHGIPASGSSRDDYRADYRVEIQRKGAVASDLGDRVRLTVSVGVGAGERTHTAWAEVMVRP